VLAAEKIQRVRVLDQVSLRAGSPVFELGCGIGELCFDAECRSVVLRMYEREEVELGEDAGA
jgi:cyclopropane fatty-acyl-phospholipid synthase-like methyltransferase